MKVSQKRRNFIDRTARKPSGKTAVKNYKEPKAHYRSFSIILEELRLQRDDIYCEVGCGGGALLKWALEKVRKAAAIDHSEEMVQLSIENNKDAVLNGNVEILQGNAETLPWATDSFTACASANMFFFIENPMTMLSEVQRVLKPGGRFSMVTMGNSVLGKITFGWLYSLKTYSNSEMTQMFGDAGFVNVSIKSQLLGTVQVCYGEKK